MSAENEIRNLMNHYCYAIDSGDLKSFGRLFKHAEWIAEGKKPGSDSLSNLIIYPDGTPRTKHTLSNITLEIDEAAGIAKGHCYVTVFQQTSDFPLQAIFAGDYYDEFKHVDGKWQFSKREIRNSLIGDMSAHLKNPSDTIPGA
ncbi:MAG: nuclear transport factor 2 family protein [Pseudomonadota bacterium]